MRRPIVIRGKLSMCVDKKIKERINEITVLFLANKKGVEATGKIKILFGIKDKRKRDLDNMVSTILDCLVDSKILIDDSISFIEKITAEVARSDNWFVEVGFE